jgi:hypothetical protein
MRTYGDARSVSAFSYTRFTCRDSHEVFQNDEWRADNDDRSLTSTSKNIRSMAFIPRVSQPPHLYLDVTHRSTILDLMQVLFQSTFVLRRGILSSYSSTRVGSPRKARGFLLLKVETNVLT